MKHNSICFFSAALLFSISETSQAGPWYTGPLLAPSGHTIPRGHTNLELYDFNTVIPGIYNNTGHIIRTPGNRSYAFNPVFSHGLTDRIDVQIIPGYNYNRNAGAESALFSDTAVTIGYQLLEQKDSWWRPDLRITLQEVLPSGNYNYLNPTKKGTDSTGLGSYQTGINFNFQQVTPFGGVHYLRTRVSIGYVTATNAQIEGFSAYGGNLTTNGMANPGDLIGVDVATEYSLTQNWVAVMEAQANMREASNFSGTVGYDANGDFATIGHGVGRQVGLAPAIEYNFSSNVGLISGLWFTVYGENTAKFVSYVLALNAFW